MDRGQIIGLIAMVISTVIGFLVRRAFNDLDDKIKTLIERCTKIEENSHKLDKDAVRVESLDRTLTDVNSKMTNLMEVRSEFLDRLGDYIRRGDFVRDIQIVTNQIEAIHKKIEYMDVKWDRLRDKQ
jgi:predicted transcriptional regulator